MKKADELFDGSNAHLLEDSAVDPSGYVVPDGYVLMPIIPTIEMMRVLRNRSIWPDDWNVGKSVQRVMGTEIIPPVTEMECACGQYQRLLKLGKTR